MSVRKPLTVKERFIASRLNLFDSVKHWDYKKNVYATHPRSASQIRQLIKQRRTRKCYDVNGNLVNIYDALRILKEDIKHIITFEQLRYLCNKLIALEAYQGHLVTKLIDVEDEIEGKSDDEIERLLLLESL